MGYDFEKEKKEAIDAGNRALQSLKDAQNHLNNAKNWGIWDMLGGGFFSTMVRAKYDLKNFSKELSDVNMVCHLDIKTGDFLSFADFFFDGFFVDWMVQDRINQASGQVEEAIRRVEGILRQIYSC